MSCFVPSVLGSYQELADEAPDFTRTIAYVPLLPSHILLFLALLQPADCLQTV
jgi:hypothetical protein